MVEQKSRREHEQPAKGTTGLKQPSANLAVHLPDDSAQRLPKPEEQSERERSGERVGAALGGLGNEARDPALEERTSHHAVLHGEEAEAVRY